MTEIPKLNYDEKGLIPVIVQDYRTNEVLMMAYSNEEAVKLMYETGYTQTGVACHTGNPSCFFKLIYGNTDQTAAIIPELIRTVEDRKNNPSEESYTCKLFGDETKMCKKIVEEAAEVALAVKDHDEDEIAAETSDLIYHTIVALVKEGVDLGKIYGELTERHS